MNLTTPRSQRKILPAYSKKQVIYNEWFGRQEEERIFTDVNFDWNENSKNAYMLYYVREDFWDKRNLPIES